jgi:hypothetical protein
MRAVFLCLNKVLLSTLLLLRFDSRVSESRRILPALSLSCPWGWRSAGLWPGEALAFGLQFRDPSFNVTQLPSNPPRPHLYALWKFASLFHPPQSRATELRELSDFSIVQNPISGIWNGKHAINYISHIIS